MCWHYSEKTWRKQVLGLKEAQFQTENISWEMQCSIKVVVVWLDVSRFWPKANHHWSWTRNKYPPDSGRMKLNKAIPRDTKTILKAPGNKKRKSNSFIQQTFLVPCYESGLSEIIFRCTVLLLSHQQTSNQEGSPKLQAPEASDRVGC